jgi:transcription elongation factor Elf1
MSNRRHHAGKEAGSGRPRRVRRAFDSMLNIQGCPECRSEHTHETIASVNDEDGVEMCLCDNCGHVELKYETDS